MSVLGLCLAIGAVAVQPTVESRETALLLPVEPVPVRTVTLLDPAPSAGQPCCLRRVMGTPRRAEVMLDRKRALLPLTSDKARPRLLES